MSDVIEEAATQPVDETLPSGSIIHWGDRDRTNSRKYGVTCGGCDVHRYTRPYPQRPTWSGFCVKCSDASHRKSGDDPHGSGSVIHWDDRDADAPSRRTAITCFKCGRRVYHFTKTISSPRWSGLCGECTHMKPEVKKEEVEEAPAKPLECCCEQCVALLARAILIPRRERKDALRGDVVHPSGTIVHRDWRDPDDPNWRFLITCHKCRHFSFTQKSNIKNPKWYGLCSNCIARLGKPKRRSKYAGKQKTRSGATIDWDAPHQRPGAALIECCNFARCSNTVERIVNANNIDDQPFYCDSCLREQSRARMQAAWDALKGSNGQKSVVKKRGRGRAPKPPEVKRAELARRQAEFEDKIRNLGKRLSRHEITRAIIADEYANDRGDIPEESTVGKWVRKFYGKGVSVPAAVNQILDEVA